MKQISVNITSKSNVHYPILFDKNVFDVDTWLPGSYSQIVIITDNTVKKYYGNRLYDTLKKSGFKSFIVSFPSGEKYKTNDTKQMIEHKLLKHRADRNTLIIALGGGVVGDLAGFIAATYLRGVAFIQIPTTLLAMVDSSVGGKTGINTPYGKNLIGAIYQPKAVIIDTLFLKTLSKKHIINGLIEAIKIFLTHDKKYFALIQKNLTHILNNDNQLLNKIIARAVAIKAAVVARDEKEMGERSVLNAGHTIGHALEKLSDYTLLHGYAVGFGLLVEAYISHLMGIIPHEDLKKIKNIFVALNIHGKYLKKYHSTDLINAMQHDKKSRSGKVRFILLKNVGDALVRKGNFTHSVSDHIIKEAFNKAISEV